jgi:hypothetical protein
MADAAQPFGKTTMIKRVAAFLGLLIAFCAMAGYVFTRPKTIEPQTLVRQKTQLPTPIDFEAGYHTPLPHLVRPHMVVLKAAHKLELYSDEKLLRAYPVDLGMNSNGPKKRQWDLCTPEGKYFICAKNPNSKYYLALGISYPNETDAQRGLADGLITKAQFNEIASAIKKGARPPRDTALGGDIVVHGRGSGADWTAGCVALQDDNMQELFEAIPVGTPVEIKP